MNKVKRLILILIEVISLTCGFMLYQDEGVVRVLLLYGYLQVGLSSLLLPLMFFASFIDDFIKEVDEKKIKGTKAGAFFIFCDLALAGFFFYHNMIHIGIIYMIVSVLGFLLRFNSSIIYDSKMKLLEDEVKA